MGRRRALRQPHAISRAAGHGAALQRQAGARVWQGGSERIVGGHAGLEPRAALSAPTLGLAAAWRRAGGERGERGASASRRARGAAAMKVEESRRCHCLWPVYLFGCLAGKK